MSNRFTIARLGAQGDGVADTPEGPVFIPFALPGEIVTAARVKDRGTLMAVVQPSPDRIEPVCRHFGVCGGCAMQHLAPKPYREWKRQTVVQALATRGITSPVDDLIPGHGGSRRRAVFSARRAEGGIVLGYNQASSHHIVDISECPVLVPEIQDAIGNLWALAALLCNTGEPFRLTVTHTPSGLDIASEGSGELGEGARRAVTDFVLRERFARLSVDGEIVVEARKPLLQFGTAVVAPPPGGFLQAVAKAEGVMAEIAADHLRKAKTVADLFAGSGAFALRLALTAEVHAVEADAAALVALDRGFRFSKGLRRVTVEKRDLFRRPLTFKELNAFGGVVFDPPRSGAEDQSTQIAKSDVPYVAAVSCNPATLARDLRILIDGGYRLKSVTPVDQFVWSPHVEVVALLEKPKARR